MHGINGFLFANLPALDMCLNDKVSWHMIGYGNEVDIHGAYFHGQTFLMNKNRKDAVNLIPGEGRNLFFSRSILVLYMACCVVNQLLFQAHSRR